MTVGRFINYSCGRKNIRVTCGITHDYWLRTTSYPHVTWILFGRTSSLGRTRPPDPGHMIKHHEEILEQIPNYLGKADVACVTAISTVFWGLAISSLYYETRFNPYMYQETQLRVLKR